MMISMDDPLHTRRRRLVYRGFTPKRVRDKEPMIRKLCTQIIDNVCERGECDFVWDIAAPLPLLLIADMLGFPPESYDDLLLWSDDLIKGTTGTPTRRDDAEVGCGGDGVPRVPTRRHRRPSGQATARRPREHPLPRGDRRREARRRVARAGDAADPHRRRRDHASRDQHAGCSRSWTIPTSARSSPAPTPRR